MSDKLDILLLDNSNNLIEEVNIIKPKSYQELLIQLRQKLKKLPKIYMIFQLSENNNEIIINNDKIYNSIKDILLIREKRDNFLGQSLSELNYKKLSKSTQEILDKKYICTLCSNRIKNEKSLFCNKCQKYSMKNA